MTPQQRELLAQQGAEFLAIYGRAPQADAITATIRDNEDLRAGDAELRAAIDALRTQVESLETKVRHGAPIEVDPVAIRKIAERRCG